METAERTTWHQQQAETDNQQQLSVALEQLKGYLRAHLESAAPAHTLSGCPALETLGSIFSLSAFEQGLLLWCAGMELDSDLAALTHQLDQTVRADSGPTFSLALAILPEAHWSALTPGGPLRYWGLVELQPGPSLTRSSLRIDERILHYVTGIQYLDECLMPFTQPVTTASPLLPSQQQHADRIVRLLAPSPGPPYTAVQLVGSDRDTTLTVVTAAASEQGVQLLMLDGNQLPTAAQELELILRRWERETLLSGCLVLLSLHQVELHDPARRSAVHQLCERLNVPFLVSGPQRLLPLTRPLVTVELSQPEAAEQQLLWEQILQDDRSRSGETALLASQFTLSASAIRHAAQSAASASETMNEHALWDACRHHARPALDGLAQRVVSQVSWHDLVLPERETALLHDITTQLRHRHTVYQQWEFGCRTSRGLGISALFAGPSGTGKTLAAEVIAGVLRLDLYKIDLSQVVSKYIGETEKNLARIFDAAEAGGAILFFDEADALFGKRSEVKDSHDRYANIEISYLLQRMEAYRGLAILTTNMKQALDSAFLRRLRFIVNFRFPDSEQRARIWRRVFPDQTPTNNLEWEKLAQLNVTGGTIRNIAVNGAFFAAADNAPVGMHHLLRAVRTEYDKLERPLSGAEIRGWPCTE